MTNLTVQFLVHIISFMFSWIFVPFYDYNITEEVATVITKPVYEVTSEDNIILQEDNPSIQIILSGSFFATVKNSNCSEIKKVKYYSNMDGAPKIYENIDRRTYR